MSTGKLMVRAYLADGALPVEGVLVRIYGTDETNGSEEHSRFTDVDGVTEAVSLPAPDFGYSTSPNPKEQPYSTYRVVASKDGYYTKKADGIAVFSGVTTVLPINMIIEDGMSTPPDGTLDSTSTEPRDLE